jgi:putative OPT family oligopeptide transporter
MTITAVLFTGALLLVFGFSGTSGMVATLGVAAIVCCAACTSGDVCNDLKTGQLVGASPRKQQIMQITGVAAAALVMAPVLQLLHANTPGGIGGKELAAPQASLFASLARGFFGDGQLPWNMVAWGAGLGLVILLIDSLLQKRGTVFRAHLMPIAVGMYLPFELATPILAGGLLAYLFTRGDSEVLAERKLRRGILFASGAIAGESLMGIGLAFVASIGIARLALPLGEVLTTILTMIAVVVILMLFYSAIKKGATSQNN